MIAGYRIASYARLFVDSQYCDGRTCGVAQAVVNVTIFAGGGYTVEVTAPGGGGRAVILAGGAGDEQQIIEALLRAARRVGAPLAVAP